MWRFGGLGTQLHCFLVGKPRATHLASSSLSLCNGNNSKICLKALGWLLHGIMRVQAQPVPGTT